MITDNACEVIPTFRTLREAIQWMYARVDDSCIDNERIIFLDEGHDFEVWRNAQMDELMEFGCVTITTTYEEYCAVEKNGCCGSSDFDVVIWGRRAIIGCNFGH